MSLVMCRAYRLCLGGAGRRIPALYSFALCRPFLSGSCGLGEQHGPAEGDLRARLRGGDKGERSFAEREAPEQPLALSPQ